MNKIIITTLVLIAAATLARAQEDVQLQLGDTLYFANGEGDSYTYIDYYQKTRFEKEKVDFDSLYNWEFYNTFFGTGDFDVTRMPKSMKGRYGIIKHFMAVQDDAGKDRNVVIVMIENGVSAAYIVEEAFLNEEVLYAPKQ
jgi:hypothetical protein